MEMRGRLLGEQPDPALCGMDPLGQQVVQPDPGPHAASASPRPHRRARNTGRQFGPHRFDEFEEVPAGSFPLRDWITTSSAIRGHQRASS